MAEGPGSIYMKKSDSQRGSYVILRPGDMVAYEISLDIPLMPTLVHTSGNKVTALGLMVSDKKSLDRSGLVPMLHDRRTIYRYFGPNHCTSCS